MKTREQPSPETIVKANSKSAINGSKKLRKKPPEAVSSAVSSCVRANSQGGEHNIMQICLIRCTVIVSFLRYLFTVEIRSLSTKGTSTTMATRTSNNCILDDGKQYFCTLWSSSFNFVHLKVVLVLSITRNGFSVHFAFPSPKRLVPISPKT